MTYDASRLTLTCFIHPNLIRSTEVIKSIAPRMYPPCKVFSELASEVVTLNLHVRQLSVTETAWIPLKTWLNVPWLVNCDMIWLTTFKDIWNQSRIWNKSIQTFKKSHHNIIIRYFYLVLKVQFLSNSLGTQHKTTWPRNYTSRVIAAYVTVLLSNFTGKYFVNVCLWVFTSNLTILVSLSLGFDSIS